MNDSKIQLSAEEMLLVQNSHWILTKHDIIDKVYDLFGNLSVEMQAILEQLREVLPEAVLQSSPKISKGEQYERLPYVVLDYPRVFSKDNVLAIRTFFWWGNYFSCTLHLKGTFQQACYKNIQQLLTNGNCQGHYLSVAGNEFNFNVLGEDYTIVEEHADHGSLHAASFIKITYKLPLAHWNETPEKLVAAFRRFITVVTR